MMGNPEVVVSRLGVEHVRKLFFNSCTQRTQAITTTTTFEGGQYVKKT